MNEVSAQAGNQLPASEFPLSGAVSLTITYFFSNLNLDVDNIPKPVSDALIGLAFDDDSQVVDLHVLKRDRNADLTFESMTPILRRGLDSYDSLLHIVIEEVLEPEVVR